MQSPPIAMTNGWVFNLSTSRRRLGLLKNLNAPAVFYTCLILYVVVMTMFGLHGSSITFLAHYFPTSDASLIGTPKEVRVDEWGLHTLAILHQAFRPSAFAAQDSSVGPGYASLLANIPVWHITAIFRPQFWGFFVLPIEQAFALYWQFKTLLLLGGVFTLLHLLTRDMALSATMSLFFFFSPHIQWAFSWASLLPEMIGLACLAAALLCYITVSRHLPLMFAAAVTTGVCAVDFALCVYPPHQIPIAWVAVAIVASWVIANRHVIFDLPWIRWRLCALAVVLLIIIIGMTSFWFDAKDAIVTAANTTYPGQRRVDGGTFDPSVLLSHFLDFWKTEANSLTLSNICEAPGFL